MEATLTRKRGGGYPKGRPMSPESNQHRSIAMKRRLAESSGRIAERVEDPRSHLRDRFDHARSLLAHARAEYDKDPYDYGREREYLDAVREFIDARRDIYAECRQWCLWRGWANEDARREARRLTGRT